MSKGQQAAAESIQTCSIGVQVISMYSLLETTPKKRRRKISWLVPSFYPLIPLQYPNLVKPCQSQLKKSQGSAFWSFRTLDENKWGTFMQAKLSAGSVGPGVVEGRKEEMERKKRGRILELW